MNQLIPAGWFPDPLGRYEHRYWNGSQWTEHVGSGGQQSIDDPAIAPTQHAVSERAAVQQQGPDQHPHTSRNTPVDRGVQRQLRKLGVTDVSPGGGTMFTEQVLVVNQKAKLFEKKAEYRVFDQTGRQVGGVRQYGHSMSRMAVGRENATKRFQIFDASGRTLLTVTRPATTMKSKVTVNRENGAPVGQIIQENFGVMASLFGGRFNIRFRMEADEVTLGTINAESWHAWDFSIQDADGVELGRITKTWAGYSKERFTKADNYVLEMHRKLEDPLLSLVVSAALVVDTVLKQGTDNSRIR